MKTRKEWVKYSLMLPMAVVGVALAEMGSDTNPPTAGQPMSHDMDRTTGMHDMTQATTAVRASKLMGTGVYSRQEDKRLGDIKDIVLDKNDTRCGYVVVSHGGVMGVGEKLYAVPFRQIQYSPTDSRSKAYVNMNEQTFVNAPSFDKNQWPTEANAGMGSDYYQKSNQYYSQQGQSAMGSAKEAMRDTGQAMKDTVNKSGEAIPAGAQVDNTGLQWTRRASSLIGTTVESPTGDNLGDVKDIVLNWQTGDVKYAVLSYGGLAGMGDKLFAVPIDQLKVQPGGDKLVLNRTKEQLKDSPGFDKNQWPDMGDPSWNKKVNDYYQSSINPSRKMDSDMNRNMDNGMNR